MIELVKARGRNRYSVGPARNLLPNAISTAPAERRAATILPRRVRSTAGRLYLGNFEILADLAGKEFVDFAMPRNRRHFSPCAVDVHRMLGTFAMKRASVLFEMSDQVEPFHCAAIKIGSRITS